MTNEDKNLLLKALCAILPYDVIVGNIYGHKHKVAEINCNFGMMKLVGNNDEYFEASILTYKPYLRPMSSMTEEEKTEVQIFIDIVTDENYGDGYSPSAWDAMNGFVQYCDSHYLDHRGMIFRGLALPASEDMYKL